MYSMAMLRAAPSGLVRQGENRASIALPCFLLQHRPAMLCFAKQAKVKRTRWRYVPLGTALHGTEKPHVDTSGVESRKGQMDDQAPLTS